MSASPDHSQAVEAIEYGKRLGWRGSAWRVRCRFRTNRHEGLFGGRFGTSLREGLLGASATELVVVLSSVIAIAIRIRCGLTDKSNLAIL